MKYNARPNKPTMKSAGNYEDRITTKWTKTGATRRVTLFFNHVTMRMSIFHHLQIQPMSQIAAAPF
jgi:hypothetical protein